MTHEMEQAARRDGLFLERGGVQESNPVIDIAGGKASLSQAKRGLILTIVFQYEARRLFGGNPIRVQRTDPSSWSIHLETKGRLHISDTKKEIQIINKDLLPENQTPFGRSPVTMIASKDCILVHLKDEDRVPINEKFRGFRQGIKQDTNEIISMKPVSLSQEGLDAYTNLTSVQNRTPDLFSKDEVRMTKIEMEQLTHSVLNQVRYLERVTPWRLARVTLPDGSKVWRAISDPIE